jgi:hypothetical protein
LFILQSFGQQTIAQDGEADEKLDQHYRNVGLRLSEAVTPHTKRAQGTPEQKRNLAHALNTRAP